VSASPDRGVMGLWLNSPGAVSGRTPRADVAAPGGMAHPERSTAGLEL